MAEDPKSDLAEAHRPVCRAIGRVQFFQRDYGSEENASLVGGTTLTFATDCCSAAFLSYSIHACNLESP